jgi:hypothetical protein
VRRLVVALIVLGASLVVPAARAGPLRVRVARAEDADPAVRQATTRLEAELIAAGFAVDIEETPATGPRGESESGDSPSFVSIAILRNGSQAVADVRVVDPISGKTLIGRVDAGSEPGPTPARTLAIRAVELLRASLLEVGLWPRKELEVSPELKTVPIDFARSMEATAAPRHAMSGWSVLLGGATSLTEGFGPTIGPSGWVSRSVATGLVVGIRWVGPTFGPELRSPVASADVRQIMALAEIRFAYGTARVAPLMALGLGAADTWAIGHAAPPLQAHTAGGLSAVVHASIGLHVRLVERLGIVLETGALGLSPVRPVRIVGEEVGNTSPASWLSSLGLVTSFD